MKLEQSFEVAAPLEQVWQTLIDVEHVAPCLPGAAVTGRNDDGSYNGTFTVKIGPTTASYSGKLEMENIDEASHTATMQAQGTDKRGQGGAKATILSRLAPADGHGTRVEVVTDYHITGRLARFGRGGMIEDISERLLREFAKRLQSSLAAQPERTADTVVSAGARSMPRRRPPEPVADQRRPPEPAPRTGGRPAGASAEHHEVLPPPRSRRPPSSRRPRRRPRTCRRSEESPDRRRSSRQRPSRRRPTARLRPPPRAPSRAARRRHRPPGAAATAAAAAPRGARRGRRCREPARAERADAGPVARGHGGVGADQAQSGSRGRCRCGRRAAAGAASPTPALVASPRGRPRLDDRFPGAKGRRSIEKSGGVLMRADPAATR